MSKSSPERRGYLAHEAREQVDAERHVAGLDDARMARGRFELGEIGLLQAGGADHVDDARLGGERREGDGGGGRREVEHAVGLGEDGQRIVGHVHVEQADAGEQPGIVPERGRALPLDGADEACSPRSRPWP